MVSTYAYGPIRTKQVGKSTLPVGTYIFYKCKFYIFNLHQMPAMFSNYISNMYKQILITKKIRNPGT